MMSNLPETAWVEAANIAAQRAYDAIGQMGDIDLAVTSISQSDATGTNSVDRSFLDYLAEGRHLNAGFLAGVQ